VLAKRSEASLNRRRRGWCVWWFCDNRKTGGAVFWVDTQEKKTYINLQFQF